MSHRSFFASVGNVAKDVGNKIENFFVNDVGKPFRNLFGKRKKRSGVNFTNILRTAFTLADPKSVKMIDNLTVFFTLLGSASVKAVRRMLMKLSPAGCGIGAIVPDVVDVPGVNMDKLKEFAKSRLLHYVHHLRLI